MTKPDPDYVAELDYHHEMYPDELEKPATLKEQLASAVSKGREILGGIKDARDELYGLNGKKGLGLHLKPIDEMEFLPVGISMDAKAPEKKRKGESTYRHEPPVVIKEVHHHHYGSNKGVAKRKHNKEKKENEDGFSRMMEPDYIPPSLKNLF